MTYERINTGGKLQRQRKPKEERFFEILRIVSTKLVQRLLSIKE
jgi:hypothetical protein